MVMTVPPSFWSYCIFAERFSGSIIVSFLSPKRYISEAFVFSTRASVSAWSSAFSVLLLKEGLLLYMPSWNLWLVSEDAYWAAAPHEQSTTAAIVSIIELFFMSNSPLFVIISYLRNLLCCAINTPQNQVLDTCRPGKFTQNIQL